MALVSTFISKGRIRIPLELQNSLGLKEGDRVDLITENDVVTLRPAPVLANRFDEFIGILPPLSNPGGVNAWVREMRDDEDSEEG